MSKLKFSELRIANVARCNASYHHIDDWSETDWAVAVAGECGEACNLIKKRRRGDNVPIEEVAKELADLVIYVDLLAAVMGIDLGAAITQKFNEVSDRVGSPIKL